MKKYLLCVVSALILIMCVLTGCSSSDTPSSAGNSSPANNTSASTEKIETQPEPTTQQFSVNDFDNLLATQPLAVLSTDYIIQDNQYKALYPDMLQAIIQNNTADDIKDAVVAFVAWDANNLPIKIEGQFDFTDGSYIEEVAYDDINLVGGATFGEGYGFSLAEDNNISFCKAIAVSYETFDGETWRNPFYSEFKNLYEGVKYSDNMTIEIDRDKLS